MLAFLNARWRPEVSVWTPAVWPPVTAVWQVGCQSVLTVFPVQVCDSSSCRRAVATPQVNPTSRRTANSYHGNVTDWANTVYHTSSEQPASARVALHEGKRENCCHIYWFIDWLTDWLIRERLKSLTSSPYLDNSFAVGLKSNSRPARAKSHESSSELEDPFRADVRLPRLRTQQVKHHLSTRSVWSKYRVTSPHALPHVTLRSGSLPDKRGDRSEPWHPVTPVTAACTRPVLPEQDSFLWEVWESSDVSLDLQESGFCVCRHSAWNHWLRSATSYSAFLLLLLLLFFFFFFFFFFFVIYCGWQTPTRRITATSWYGVWVGIVRHQLNSIKSRNGEERKL